MIQVVVVTDSVDVDAAIPRGDCWWAQVLPYRRDPVRPGSSVAGRVGYVWQRRAPDLVVGGGGGQVIGVPAQCDRRAALDTHTRYRGQRRPVGVLPGAIEHPSRVDGAIGVERCAAHVREVVNAIAIQGARRDDGWIPS